MLVDSGLLFSVAAGLAVGIGFVVAFSILSIPNVIDHNDSAITVERVTLPPNTVLTIDYGIVDCGEANVDDDIVKLCSEVYGER